MNRLLIYMCFYWPLFSSALNIQGFVNIFGSTSLSQILAYFNVLLILTGIFLIKKEPVNFSKTNKLWFGFYILYYSIGLLASAIHGFNSAFLATLIAPIYFIGFYILLSNPDELKRFFKILTFTYVITSLVTIFLLKVNFNFDDGKVLGWSLDRAEGVYGDANNAALASIIAYLLLDKCYNPTISIFRVFKILLLLTVFYSLFLTFSTTGLFIFAIVFLLTNYKYFTGLKLIFLGVIVTLFYTAIFAFKSQIQSLNLSKAQIYKIENIINLLTLNIEKVDNSGRSELMENILTYIYKNPMIGNGIDFSVVTRGHNTYLGVWADAGIVVFLFFIFLLFFYFLKAFSLNVNYKYFTISVLFSLYISMISLQTVLNQPYIIVLFVFIGYIIDYDKSNHLKTIINKNNC